MNVPSKSSYQSTCVTRTVQSIDKAKMRNAGIKRCVCPPPPPSCIPPTAGEITNSSEIEGIAILTVAYTGATSFQWWYSYNPLEDPFPPQRFVDGPEVSGSTTPTLTLTRVIGSNLRPVYCIVTNACGSATSVIVNIGFLLTSQ